MPAKPSSPPARRRLLVANVLVWGAVAILIVAYFPDLKWAQATLRVHLLGGQFDPPADRILLGQAIAQLKAGAAPADCIPMLEQAIEIDPNSAAWLVLGDCHLQMSQNEQAFDCYDRYRRIDSLALGAYRGIWQALNHQTDRERLLQILDEGIEAFEHRVQSYSPIADETVAGAFNQKARQVYEDLQSGLAALQGMRRQLAQDR